MLYPQGKDKIPQRCFPYSNLGQECCTALPSVLHWEPRPRNLNGGLSIGSSFVGPAQGCHKTVTFAQAIRNTHQHCRPLLASTRFGGPCCLVLQSFQVRSTLLVAIQVNESYKNQSLVSKCHAIAENSKLNKYSHLVEYSWQTQCLDAPR